jgi:hypothetical protein
MRQALEYITEHHCIRLHGVALGPCSLMGFHQGVANFARGGECFAIPWTIVALLEGPCLSITEKTVLSSCARCVYNYCYSMHLGCARHPCGFL